MINIILLVHLVWTVRKTMLKCYIPQCTKLKVIFALVTIKLFNSNFVHLICVKGKY